VLLLRRDNFFANHLAAFTGILALSVAGYFANAKTTRGIVEFGMKLICGTWVVQPRNKRLSYRVQYSSLNKIGSLVLANRVN
jgi:hypothetical protein